MVERVGFEDPELLLLLPPGPPEPIPPADVPVILPGPPGPPIPVLFVPLGGGPYMVVDEDEVDVRSLLDEELARAKDEPVAPSEICD